MPLVDFNNSNNTSWMENASKLWDIPLYPLGESNLLDYYAGLTASSMEEQRVRLAGIQKELLLAILVVGVFTYNSSVSIRMVMARSQAISSWCCIITSISGLVIGIMKVFTMIGVLVNCRMIIWSVGFGIGIGTFCNSIILLQKAYIILDKQKLLVYISFPFMLPQLFFSLVMMRFTFIGLEVKDGCTLYYPSFFVWYWIGISAPINTIFSFIFCFFAYKQYRRFGSGTWKQLTNDGIQTIALALFCNALFSVPIVLQLKSFNADHLYVVDWIVVSTILINHCNRMRKMIGFRYRSQSY
ncbi:hypothetical protein BDF22DRAFT_674036 [Syncephalis plumigaleata]|nr:hypothetical protein BDF22DRAFT_674036 [Syncephalis plumigaleata]